jgi:hypothetical protein
MTERFTEFLLAAAPQACRTLPQSIRQVRNASSGFCNSWLRNEWADASKTSEEAFEALDHIQNELLRHRDRQAKLPGWKTSALCLSIEERVGDLLNPANTTQVDEFLAQIEGQGEMPAGGPIIALTLGTALNKLKHHAPGGIRFSITSGKHMLFFYTQAAQKIPNTIASFDVQTFLDACTKASQSL